MKHETPINISQHKHYVVILAYYAAAWVCGSFFFIVGRYYEDWRNWDVGPGPFIGSFQITLLFSWPSILLFAFLLKKVARGFHLSTASMWSLVGASLALLFGLTTHNFLPLPLVASEDSIRSLFSEIWRPFELSRAASFPWFFWREVFTVAFGGLSTGYVLYKVSRTLETSQPEGQTSDAHATLNSLRRI